MSQELPSASDSQAVQEALSVRYVDKIGLAWLPASQQWAVFANSGNLWALLPSLEEGELKEFCEGQNKEWRAQREREEQEQRSGPVVVKQALGDLDL